jgi:hypothetical protein
LERSALALLHLDKTNVYPVQCDGSFSNSNDGKMMLPHVVKANVEGGKQREVLSKLLVA